MFFAHDHVIGSLIAGYALCLVSFYVFSFISEGNLTSARNQSSYISSSVWCSLSLCVFKNLCYSNNTFIFSLTAESDIYGLKREDFQSIRTSSVLTHNGLFLKIVITPPNATIIENFTITENPVFLIGRFKPDNILHVVHDDLLPLYLTYKTLCSGDIFSCVSSYQLVFVDGFPQGPFIEWYRIFSNSEPLSLPRNDAQICFSQSRVGLLTDSLFFDYGFQKPQEATMAKVPYNFFRKFSDYTLSRFNVKTYPIDDSKKCTLISRKINRKILNEDFIESNLKKIHNSLYSRSIHLEKYDVADVPTTELLQAVASSKCLVGMHGSAMILAIFLPPLAGILELFPFGITAENVSPLKSLSRVPGFPYKYRFWENVNPNLTYTHPEYPPVFGGIQHLSEEEQDSIDKITEVPAVECCQNPIYLYRMYQDTLVDDSLIPVLRSVLQNEMKPLFNYEEYLHQQWYFPGPVRNIACNYNQDKLLVSWEKPLNLANYDAQYQVAVSTPKQNYLVISKQQTVGVKIGANDSNVKVWIKCIVGIVESPDTFFTCKD